MSPKRDEVLYNSYVETLKPLMRGHHYKWSQISPLLLEGRQSETDIVRQQIHELEFWRALCTVMGPQAYVSFIHFLINTRQMYALTQLDHDEIANISLAEV